MGKCASLGNVNSSLITALYHACQGDSGLKEYELRTSKGQGRALGQAVAAAKAHTRIFFPSLETVAQSKGGKDVSGHPVLSGTPDVCCTGWLMESL
jgi:hypothetical protein